MLVGAVRRPPALQTLAILQMHIELDAAAQALARQVIATDIGYLLAVYRQPTKGLWEERDGYSFFPRAVQLRCFAALVGNSLGIPVPVGVTPAIGWLQARVPEHWNSTETIYVTFGGPESTQDPPLTPGYDPNADVVMAAFAVPSCPRTPGCWPAPPGSAASGPTRPRRSP